MSAQQGRSNGYAVLYSEENYSGTSSRIMPGDELTSISRLDNGRWFFQNLNIRSIEIHGNIVLELWSEDRFHGKSIRISQSHSNLMQLQPSEQNWKDRVASLKVAYESPQLAPSSQVAPTTRPAQAVNERPQRPQRLQRTQRPSSPPRRVQGEVKIFSDGGFRGSSVTFDRGQTVENLNHIAGEYGRWNDRISSIYIKGPYTVVLYQDANFRGYSLRISESISNMNDLRARDPSRRNWNDAVSSIEIIETQTDGNGSTKGLRIAGTIFEDNSYNGDRIGLYEGQAIPNLRDIGWNDRISSIMLERGFTVLLYKDANFRGESIVVDKHEPSFRGALGRWNDQASSLKVLKGN